MDFGNKLVVVLNPYWGLNIYKTILECRVLQHINLIDIEEDWDKTDNKEKYLELRDEILDLEQLSPIWHFDQNDVSKYSDCPSCSTLEKNEITTLDLLKDRKI